MRRASFVKWGTLLIFGVLAFRLQAQSDSLSKGPALFFHQLSNDLLKTQIPEYRLKANNLLISFGNNWRNGRFTKIQQEGIRKTVKLIHSETKRIFPYLYNYLYSANLLIENHRTNREFQAWQRYITVILKKRQFNTFLKFLSFTNKLLKKHVLCGKTSTPWHFRRAVFSFFYDTTFYVQFQHLDLIKASRNDSLMITQTKGRFIYSNWSWQGKNGILKWNRFSKGFDENYHIAGHYHFRLNTNIIHIDSVQLTYPAYLKNQAVYGRLSDRVLTGKPSPNSVYPKFTSYNSNLYLPEIYPHVSFHGGIQIAGKRFFGSAINNVRPEIDFTRNHQTVIKLWSRLFEFDKDKIISDGVDASLMAGKDSIYHPQLQMLYEVGPQKLQLYTLNGSKQQIPFFDSYHKLDLFVPSLVWHLHADSIIFKKIRGVNDNLPAYFESNHYFDPREFYALQGIDEINPLYVIQDFMRTYSTKRISVAALSSFMNKSPGQAEELLMDLSNKGFVVYDSETKTALVTNRLLYFINAKAGRTDYDIIHFISDRKRKPNASLNLKNFNLNIYGVPRIFISDSQQVFIYPYHKKIAVRKNRDFTFNGKVTAGLFNFYTRKSTFVYDSFMIRMNHVDSLSLGIWEKDTLHHRRFVVHIKQTIQKLRGKLYVDLPFNKSGLMHVPRYPEFVSKSEGYVYYNSRKIQDSTLLPDRFYYRVAPSIFDSIKTFNTSHIIFQGSLVSDSIFKPIKKPLRVMADHSLGFVYVTPPPGLPVYGGKGRFTDTLTLNMQGLHGNGTLHYLTTSVRSKDFRFFPDSVISVRAKHLIGKTDSVRYHFPSVSGDSMSIVWNTQKNKMSFTSLGPPYQLYGKTTLSKKLTLTPGSMTGSGLFTFGHSILNSRYFSFTNQGLKADSANFILKNPKTGDITFMATNYRAKIDFKNHKGWFNHLDSHSYLKFPYNGYISTLDEAEWLMNKNKLSLFSTHNEVYDTLNSLPREQLIAYHQSGPEFIATGSAEDSLQFYAKKAFYNIRQNTIDVKGVKLIKVADAAIFPAGDSVRIMQKGKLAPLVNARILVDTANFYHNIYDARVNILSKNKYTASGKLDYKDMNATLQPISMKRVYVNTRGKTVATGLIPKDEIFFLNPDYFFTGKVIMHAEDRFLHFQGGYQLNENCLDNAGNRIAINQDIDPDHLAFRFDGHTRTTDSLRAWFGLAYSFQYHDYYPLVLQALRKPLDEVLISATGYLTINHQNGRFMMGPSAKKDNNNLKGNFVELDTKNCQMDGNGIFNLGFRNSMLKARFIGSFRFLVESDSTLLHVIMMLRFPFDQTALNLMADSIRMIPSKRIHITKGLYPKVVRRLLPPQKAQKALTELSLYGQIKKLPASMNSTLSFNDLHLVWDPLSRSFFSYGPIGIGSIGGNVLNKYMQGILQIRKDRSGSTIEFFLRGKQNQWYYFNYDNGFMQALSSDKNFNNTIKNLKKDNQIWPNNKNKGFYELVPAGQNRVINFLRNMKRLGRLK